MFSSLIRRSLALASAALLTGGLASATAVEAQAASSEIIIIDGYSQSVKESAGTPVLCPTDQVLLGRAHSGDENGQTTYYCGIVIINGVLAKTSAPTWSNNMKESNSFFAAAPNHALVGRQHTGDENGNTRYATSSLTVNGKTVHLVSYRWSPPQKESSSYSKAGDLEIMTGRQHSGDENGPTSYQYARVTS